MLLCSGQHQNSNCFWVAKDAPLYHMIFDGLGGMNKSWCILPRSWDEFHFFVCFVLFGFKGLFKMSFPDKNDPTSDKVRGIERSY